MWGSRTQWYRSIAVGVVWQEKAWQDDRKFTVEDIDETLWAIAGIALIWRGELILAAIPGINLVEGAVVVSVAASFAIGGVEGVEDYIDYITEWKDIPSKLAWSAKTIYEHKIKEPLEEAAEWYVEKVEAAAQWYVTQVDQGIDYVNDTVDSATNWIARNKPQIFFTGPYLPF